MFNNFFSIIDKENCTMLILKSNEAEVMRLVTMLQYFECQYTNIFLKLYRAK
jgi:hypothetical protein